MNHLDHTTLCEWTNKEVQDKNSGKKYKNVSKIVIMNQIEHSLHKYIFFMKDDNVRKDHLVNNNYQKPQHSDE